MEIVGDIIDIMIELCCHQRNRLNCENCENCEKVQDWFGYPMFPMVPPETEGSKLAHNLNRSGWTSLNDLGWSGNSAAICASVEIHRQLKGVVKIETMHHGTYPPVN